MASVPIERVRPRSRALIVGLTAAGLLGAGGWMAWDWFYSIPAPAIATPKAESAAAQSGVEGSVENTIVQVSADQQQVIGVQVQTVPLGSKVMTIKLPGRIVPDETKFAYITPRAAGVVRSVAVRIGQEVQAGDVLATIESPEVGQARLDLLTQLQSLDVATAQAKWQETIYRNTLDLVDRLRAEDTPDQIHEQFANRPVGTNRDRLMTAYTSARLSKATLGRKSDLFNQEVIRGQQLEEVKARYEADLATLQSLTDQMGYEGNLAHVRAQQALRQAETAVLVARERLQMLGVDPDDTEFIPRDIRPLATAEPLSPGAATLATPKPGEPAAAPRQTPAAGALSANLKQPASVYKLIAPFAGTILDRELLVPGVPVGIGHRVLTLANLDHVWIEVNVNVGSLAFLQSGSKPQVRFSTEAYPGREFVADVLYSGDQVIEKTQTVNLLARSDNPDRMLKPGSYVEVTLSLGSEEKVPIIPSSALVTEDQQHYVFVRLDPAQFQQREVRTTASGPGLAAVLSGLKEGEEIVTNGSFKLKAKLLRQSAQ